MTHGLPKNVNENDTTKDVNLLEDVDHVVAIKKAGAQAVRLGITEWSYAIEQLQSSVNSPKKLSRHLVILMTYQKLRMIRRRSNMRKIESPPGFTLFKILEFFCCKKTVERVIEPMHAEYLVEYFEALKAGRGKKAVVIKCQMMFFLIYGVLSSKVLFFLGKCIQAAFKAKTGE